MNIYKEMYYHLFSVVADVIEKGENIDEVKALLVKAEQETEEMFMNYKN